MNKYLPQYVIIIDDDPVNNILCSRIFKLVFPEITVKTFLVPEKGLEFIKTEVGRMETQDIIVFLDINMPTMSGWEFLEHYKDLAEELKNKMHVYIVSSSVDLRDKQKALDNKNVADYIVKPILKEKIEKLFKDSKE